jgi:hypothetical protein
MLSNPFDRNNKARTAFKLFKILISNAAGINGRTTFAINVWTYLSIDNSSYRLIFYLDKKDEIYHYSSKEHPNIS